MARPAAPWVGWTRWVCVIGLSTGPDDEVAARERAPAVLEELDVAEPSPVRLPPLCEPDRRREALLDAVERWTSRSSSRCSAVEAAARRAGARRASRPYAKRDGRPVSRHWSTWKPTKANVFPGGAPGSRSPTRASDRKRCATTEVGLDAHLRRGRRVVDDVGVGHGEHGIGKTGGRGMSAGLGDASRLPVDPDHPSGCVERGPARGVPRPSPRPAPPRPPGVRGSGAPRTAG